MGLLIRRKRNQTIRIGPILQSRSERLAAVTLRSLWTLRGKCQCGAARTLIFMQTEEMTMQTVIIQVQNTSDTYIRMLAALPSAGDTIGIYVDGQPITLRVSHVHYPQHGEGIDSTPTVWCVEIAEAADVQDS